MFKQFKHKQEQLDSIRKQKGDMKNMILHKAIEIASNRSKSKPNPIIENNAENDESLEREDIKSQKSKQGSQKIKT